jgi:hypothetical protein
VAPPELVDCVWTHRSHSRMIRGFALSCFIQRAPSEIGPFRSAGMAALGANDWETVFPNGKMRRNSRGIQEKTQTKRPPEGGLSVALMLTQFRLHGTHVPPPIILPSHPMVYSMRHQCGYKSCSLIETNETLPACHTRALRKRVALFQMVRIPPRLSKVREIGWTDIRTRKRKVYLRRNCVTPSAHHHAEIFRPASGVASQQWSL